MPTNIRKYLLVSILIVILFICPGCVEETQNNESDTTYTSDIAASPQQYTMFINKEIEPLTNHLVTQMGLADKVSAGEYPVQDALTSVQSAISAIEESIRQVDITLPPANYMTLRTDVLQAMVNAKDTLETYENELKQPFLNKDNIEKLRDVMEGDFTVLTGLYNVYHE